MVRNVVVVADVLNSILYRERRLYKEFYKTEISPTPITKCNGYFHRFPSRICFYNMNVLVTFCSIRNLYRLLRSSK